MLFRVALSICIPTNTVRGFLFLHVLSSFYFFVEFLVVAVLTGMLEDYPFSIEFPLHFCHKSFGHSCEYVSSFSSAPLIYMSIPFSILYFLGRGFK